MTPHVRTDVDGPVATVTLARGKVNALNEAVVEALREAFRALERDDGVRAVVLTGTASFFSFGFDVPEFLDWPRPAFRSFLEKFTSLYAGLYLFEKPVVAALNGHTIAGGCMIALACDCRMMASGKGRISLNEISFGSTVFAGSVEMLKGVVGQRNAETILLEGALYSAEEARTLGLVDRVCAPADLGAEAGQVAASRGARDLEAYRSLKRLVRRRVADELKRREAPAITEFLDIWYSAATRERLKHVAIRP